MTTPIQRGHSLTYK
jgi:hypothetical protein